MRQLHIDIETYSEVNLPECGVHKYANDPSFEILILAYSLDDDEVTVIDVYREGLPFGFIQMLLDPDIMKVAHNATFERTCFAAVGYATPVEQWTCTAIMAAYCGLPLGLHDVSLALALGDKSKDIRGRMLIRQFSVSHEGVGQDLFGNPVNRVYPEQAPEDWKAYKGYCGQDVVAEKEIYRRLSKYNIPEWERKNYILDQKINDYGVLVDVEQARNAANLATEYKEHLKEEFTRLTGVRNPRSPKQMLNYLAKHNIIVQSVAKDALKEVYDMSVDTELCKALEIRSEISKSATSKFTAMVNGAEEDGRIRGTLQFYGARTGRWAGRRVQLHNMTKDKGDMDLDTARELLKANDTDTFNFMFPEAQYFLSQLVRTCFVAPEGHSFLVADFSAIEARVLAWIAQEHWRLDVFNTHGKIYEASASMMFHVPIESVTKTSPLRQKGKIAELALGYQGSFGAMVSMGAKKFGLSDDDINDTVQRWREKSPNIKKYWYKVEQACINATKNKGKAYTIKGARDIKAHHDGAFLRLLLPSGRCLFYPRARLGKNKFGSECVEYYGKKENSLVWIGAYGGSFTENIIQAIARDLLCKAMQNLDKAGYPIVLHVHDEAVIEVPDIRAGKAELAKVYNLMCDAPEWAEGLPLKADGFISKFYRK